MSKLCLNRKNTQDILQSLRCSNLFFLFFSIFSHGKAELDAAGFIRAEENDKWAQT